MKKIWNYLKWHFINDFHPWHYLSIAAFLITCLSLNYWFDFEDNYLETMIGYPKFFAYLVFYSVPYLFAVYLYTRHYKRPDVWRNKNFLIKASLGLVVLSLDGSLPYVRNLVNYFSHPATQYWATKVAVNGISFFTIMLPLFVFHKKYENDQTRFYGLTAYKFDARPYFTMLAIMVPLLVTASFSEGFLRQYPMYKVSAAHIHLGIPEWVTVAGYEVAYGLDFITVELLFRGFLVIGMISILGRGSVLCMAVLYCVLHFGKPAGEAISSIFGGYILGVVAYETRSIWGGVIVHMGIAWMMEVIAFAQKSLHGVN